MTLARRERLALCDLALAVGPTAPTLCDGWDARDLMAHLIVREHSPLGAVGIAVPPLARLTEQRMARLARRPFPDLVDRVRRVGLTPYRLPGVEWLANTIEYVVHHEDLRRGQPSWSPRTLPDADEDTLWTQLRVVGRLSARRAGVPLVIRRPSSSASLVLLGGDSPVTVTGQPSELVLLLSGRKQLRGLVFDGPPAAVERFRQADLSA